MTDALIKALNRNSKIVALSTQLRGADTCGDCRSQLATWASHSDHGSWPGVCDACQSNIAKNEWDWRHGLEVREMACAKRVRRLEALLMGES
jgi:hypothetical protein